MKPLFCLLERSVVRYKMLPATVPSLATDLPRHQRTCDAKSKSEALLFAIGQHSAAKDGLTVSFLCLDDIPQRSNLKKNWKVYFEEI